MLESERFSSPSNNITIDERLWPTAVNKATQKNYVKPSSPTYIVIGNAGNIEGLTDSGWNPLGFGGWQVMVVFDSENKLIY